MTPRVLLFSGIAFLLAPVATFAPHGVVPLVVVAAIFSLADSQVRQAFRLKPPLYVWFFVLALAWALVSVFWTLETSRGLRVFGGLAVLFVIARVLAVSVGCLTDEERDILSKRLVLAGCLLVVLLVFENIMNGPITRIFHEFPGKTDDHMPSLNPGAVILAVMSWPLTMAVARRHGWRWAFVVLLVVGGTVFLARTKTPFAALCFSVVVFLILVRYGRWAVRAFSILIPGFLLVAPFAFQLLLFPADERRHLSRLAFHWEPFIHRSSSHSWEQRTWIWRFVMEKLKEHPFFGWGLDASRYIEGGREPIVGYEATFGEKLPLHPHNAFLQVWLELGGTGAVLLALAIGSLLFAIGKSSDDNKEVAAFYSLAVTYVAIGQVSFGAWQNWWLATAIVGMTFFLAVRPKPGPN